MYPTLLTLCLALTILFITPLTSAYHLARSNSDPPSATPTWSTSTSTGPDTDNSNKSTTHLNGTHTTSSEAAVDTSNWVITYCNTPYDPVTGGCRGLCTTWKVAEKGNDGPGDAKGTNCIYTTPPFEVTFKVCSRSDGFGHCHWSDDKTAFHPWLYPDNDQNGVSVYNTVGTNEIYLGPRLS